MNKLKFYLIWKEESLGSTPTYKHHSYQSAVTECKRLTEKYGGTFHILGHVASAKKTDVVFIDIFQDNIPF